MKYLIITLALAFNINSMVAQTVSMIDEVPLNFSENTEPVRSSNNYANHTKSATTLLNKHFEKNIKYPEIMYEYGIEGSILVEVIIDKNGAINSATVVKSFSNQLIKYLNKELSKYTDYKVTPSPYQGSQIIYVPVQYTL